MKISVCIPTFNQANYIEAAVRSAAKQTYQPFEIIVFDDCSTDNTYAILTQLSKEIPTLKLFKQQKNVGISGNVDMCLRAATGEIIIRLDSDDQLLPLYTEKLLKVLKQYPKAGYAHCAIQEIDQFGTLLKERHLIRPTGYKSAINALVEARKGYKVAANIIMFKKQALEAVNYLQNRPNFGEDYHLTSAISAADFGNVYVDEVLACYRLWVDGGKIRQKRKLAEIDGIRHVFDDVLQPAYLKNNWKMKTLEKSRENFACAQADCLNWVVYSNSEKDQIKKEIYKLSDSSLVKITIWLYQNNLGMAVLIFDRFKSLPRAVVKEVIKKINNLVIVDNDKAPVFRKI